MHITRDDSQTWHRARSHFTSSSTLGDAAGHGPIYDYLSYPSPAIDFDMELPLFLLLIRRFCFVMMCTGLSQVQAHRAESKRKTECPCQCNEQRIEPLRNKLILIHP